MNKKWIKVKGGGMLKADNQSIKELCAAAIKAAREAAIHTGNTGAMQLAEEAGKWMEVDHLTAGGIAAVSVMKSMGPLAQSGFLLKVNQHLAEQLKTIGIE